MNLVNIGCGYIGTEVASLWTKKGNAVTVTTRSPDRLDALSKVSQKSLILKPDSEEELIPLLTHNEVILITIAADSIDHYESAYLHTAQIFRRLAIEMNLPRRLIYTSSTSVYGDHQGLWVDENTPLLAVSDQAKTLIEAEKIFLSLQDFGWQVCVLRLAEIYGPGRELSRRVRHLEGHSLPGTGDQYTNMIHRDDCVFAIDYCLRHHLQGIFNLADDEHPTRKELYDLISAKFHLPKVSWDPRLTGLHTGNKRVSNHLIKAQGFAFHHPHRILD